MTHTFKPTPSPIAMAIWKQLRRLSLPLTPTAGINWRAYVRSGGPAQLVGR